MFSFKVLFSVFYCLTPNSTSPHESLESLELVFRSTPLAYYGQFKISIKHYAESGNFHRWKGKRHYLSCIMFLWHQVFSSFSALNSIFSYLKPSLFHQSHKSVNELSSWQQRHNSTLPLRGIFPNSALERQRWVEWYPWEMLRQRDNGSEREIRWWMMMLHAMSRMIKLTHLNDGSSAWEFFIISQAISFIILILSTDSYLPASANHFNNDEITVLMGKFPSQPAPSVEREKILFKFH